MSAASLAALGVGVLQSGFNAWLGDEMQNRYMANWGGPEAQMEHMRAAGVNPFTAAGNLSGSAGDTNVGSTIGGYDLNNSIASLANSQMNPTVEDNTKSGTKKNEADAKVSETVAEGQEIQNEINSDTKENQKQEIRDRARKQGYDADIAEVTALYADDIEKATLDNLDADYQLKVKQHEQAQKQMDLIDKQINEIDENIKVLKEQVKYYKSIEELNQANKLLAEEEKKKVEKENEKLAIENEILEFDSSKDLTGQYYRIRKKYGKDFADQWIKDAKQNIKDRKEAEAQGEETGVGKGKSTYDYEVQMQSKVISKINGLNERAQAAQKEYDDAARMLSVSRTGSTAYHNYESKLKAAEKKLEDIANELNDLNDTYKQYDWYWNKGGKTAKYNNVTKILNTMLEVIPKTM